jgi:hypothetical protein
METIVDAVTVVTYVSSGAVFTGNPSLLSERPVECSFTGWRILVSLPPPPSPFYLPDTGSTHTFTIFCAFTGRRRVGGQL